MALSYWPATLLSPNGTIMTQSEPNVPKANPIFSESLRVFRVLMLAALGVRLLYGAVLQLAPDEAFYWALSRHLAMGYLDHPPMIAYLIWVGTHVLGSNELGVRLLAVVMALGAIVIVVWLGGRVLRDTRATLWLAILWLTSPLLAGLGTIFTPDTPLVFFSLIALVFAILIAERADRGERGGTALWLPFGLFVGLGLLSKYTAVLLPASVGFAFLFSGRGAREFRRPWIYLAGVVALLVFSPVILWNADHHWASFLFQLHHGTAANEGAGQSMTLLARVGLLFKDLGTYLGGQAVIWTPVLFGIAVIVLVRDWLSYRRLSQVERVLLWAGTLPLVFFAVACVKSHHTEINWPAFAYFPISILTVKWLAESWSEARLGWLRVGCQVAVAFTTVLHVIFIPAVTRGLEQTRLRLPHLMTDLTEWRRSGPILGKWAAENNCFVVTNRHQDAGEAAFYMPGQPEVWCVSVGSRPTAFDYFYPQPDFAKIPRVLWLGGHVNLFAKQYGYVEAQRLSVTFPGLKHHNVMTAELLVRGR
jgi:4-amino-4-deoxy-L-arabinose transferase-like glycosyltransferase